MRTNINVELFKRYAPKKKLEIIESLTSDDLMNISTATITRIVKEAGNGSRTKKRSCDKDLWIRSSLQSGNNWNSTIERISYYKKVLYIDLYLQYENTDTSETFKASMLFSKGETRFGIERRDRYYNPRTYYAVYDQDDKAEVVRSILKEYIHSKYSDKLKQQQ